MTQAKMMFTEVNIHNIRIKEGFNPRMRGVSGTLSEEEYEERLAIKPLSEDIQANGLLFPLIGDIEDGIFYIIDGERRYRALKKLVATGKFPLMVPVILGKEGMSELEKKMLTLSTNNNLKLTKIERAHLYLEMKTKFNLTNYEIADMCNVSRQTVDNSILATQLPIEVQQKIEEGAIRISAAIQQLRKEKRNQNGDPENNIINVDATTGEFVSIESDIEYHRDEDTFIDSDDHPLHKTKEEIQKEKERDKYKAGDEDEFAQQDNSVSFAGSMNMKEDKSSNAITVGKDSIYVTQQKQAVFRQFINRLKVVSEMSEKIIVSVEVQLSDAPEEVEKLLAEKRLQHTINKLMDEYNITVR